ncbi:MAG: hypothetical protein JWM46_80 [Candidatus Kaiserbacteria bacterium]|nr:hypothetical protein [Candidatus Kaiserbacteria bacterium]
MNETTATETLPEGSDEKPELRAESKHQDPPLHETVDAFDNLNSNRGW